MKPALALAVLVALCACKREPETGPAAVPTVETIAGVAMIDYVSDEAKFSCRVPGEWGVREPKHLDPSKGLSLWDGKATHISILKFPDAEPRYKDARAYAESLAMIAPDGKAPEIAEEKIGGRTVLRFHYERMPYPKRTRDGDRPNRLDSALIPVPGGFYELQHTAPADAYLKTLPVFEAVVRSFQPKI